MSGEKKMEVLVRGVRPGTEVYHDAKTAELYWRYEFFRVDLNSDVGDDHVLEPYLDPLMSTQVSCVVFSKSVAYVVGYAFEEEGIIPDSIAYVKVEDKEGVESTTEKFRCFKLKDSTTPNPEGGEKVACLKSVSCVNLKSQTPKKWKTLPSGLTSALGSVGGILNGKLYCLSSGFLSESQCYNYRRNKWFPVPAPPPKAFNKCYITPKILPDPDNNRFFVHVSHGGVPSPNVYAWHPDFAENPWYPMLGHLPKRYWKKKTVHADKMFFFYSWKFPGLFQVVSYEDRTWLQLEWSTPHPLYVKANSVCYLGNQQLCVFTSSFIEEPFIGCRLFFYIFAFEKKSDSSITFKHCFTRSLFAKHIRIAEEVVFIPGDER